MYINTERKEHPTPQSCEKKKQEEKKRNVIFTKQSIL